MQEPKVNLCEVERDDRERHIDVALRIGRRGGVLDIHLVFRHINAGRQFDPVEEVGQGVGEYVGAHG